MIVNGDISFKFLSKEEILRELNKIPDNSVVYVNRVGNLTIANKYDFEFIGYICFLEGIYEDDF